MHDVGSADFYIFIHDGVRVCELIVVYLSIYLHILSQSISDHHLRCWVEFSKMGRTFGMGKFSALKHHINIIHCKVKLF